MSSEAAYTDKINRANAEAEAIIKVAKATAESIEVLAKSINETGGASAVAMKLGESYIHALSLMASKNNTMIVPANVNDPSSMIAQGLAVFKNISAQIDNKK